MNPDILLKNKGLLCLSVFALVTFLLSEIVIFMLSGEFFVVISQVLFIIIIFIALVLPEKSTISSVLIGIVYLLITGLVTYGDISGIIPAMAQFYVFVSMSIVLSLIIRAIHYSERKYYSLLENTSRGICIYDIERCQVVEKNRGFVYDPEFILGYIKKERDGFFESGKDPDSAAGELTFELEYEFPGGDKRDLLVFAEKLFEKHIILIITDISRRKRDEENIQVVSSLGSGLLMGSNTDVSLSFTSYAARNVSQVGSVAIYLSSEDKNTFHLASSRNLPASLERDLSEIGPGNKIWEIIESGAAESLDTGVTGIRFDEGEGPSQRKILVIPVYMSNRPGGGIIAISEDEKDFSDSSRNSLESIAHIFGSAMKRIRAENEILSIKTNLESLFESMEDFIFVFGKDGKILHTNPSVYSKLGYGPEETGGMNIAGLHGCSSFGVFMDAFASLVSGESNTASLNLMKKNGESIPVDMKAVTGTWGDSEAFFVIDRDMTIRKRQGDEIRSRDAILDSVSAVAENFLNAPDWTTGIGESLERIGRAADVASVCLFEQKRVIEGDFNPDNIYKWVNPGYRFIPDMDSFKKLELFSDGGVDRDKNPARYRVVELDKDSVSPEDRRIFGDLNIETILAVPLVVEGSFRGLMCLVEGKKRVWSTAETDAIRIAGEIISSAINRTETEEIFRNPIERSLVGVFLVKNSMLEYVNPKFAEMIGYSRDELMGKASVIDLVHEDYRYEVIERTKNSESLDLEKEEDLPDYHFEVKGVRKDGSLIDVEVYGSLMLRGGELSFVGMAVDITKRKEAERALTESEALTRLIIDNLPVGISLSKIGPPVSFEYFNENFLKFYRISAEDISQPDSFWSAVFEDPAFREEMKQRALEDTASGDPGRMVWKDVPIKRSGEETTYINARNTPIPGRNLMISTVWDVTKDREMEEKLKESQERLSEAMDLAHLVNWEYDVATDTFTFDNRFYALYGSTGELEGGSRMKAEDYTRKFVHPDDAHLVAEQVKKAIETADPDFISEIEHRIIRRDGEVRYIVVRFSLIKDRDGRTIRTRGANQDITELKMAQEKLYESTERLNLALKTTRLGIYDWNIRDNTLSYNDELFTMLGYTPEDYVEGRVSFGDIIHPDDLLSKEEKLKEHLEGKTPYYETEYRMRAKDGEWRWMAVRGEVVERDPAGRAVRITGTHFDISERKRDEERITHLNKVLKAVRNVNELIVRETDINRLIKGACRLMVETRGYLDAWVILTDRYGSYLDSAGSGDRGDVAGIISETVSGNPPKVLADALRTTDIFPLSGHLNTGEPAGGEGVLLCRRLDYGSTIFGVIIISIPAALSEDSDELGLFNELASDISFAIHDILLQKERKSYEEQVLKSLEEKTVLLQEVHHRVKNNLQIISGLIKMQARSIEDKSARESLLNCENRIMALAMVHEALYRSENLSEISARDHFVNLAQTLVDSLSFTEYKNIGFKADVHDINLPISVAIPCSLIINEIISNSIKYAFEGMDSGMISLVFHEEADEYYLEISDNGVGVPDEYDPEKSKSLGMRLVRRLAVEQLKGRTEIKTNGGTSFIFIFPKSPKQVS